MAPSCGRPHKKKLDGAASNGAHDDDEAGDAADEAGEDEEEEDDDEVRALRVCHAKLRVETGLIPRALPW